MNMLSLELGQIKALFALKQQSRSRQRLSSDLRCKLTPLDRQINLLVNNNLVKDVDDTISLTTEGEAFVEQLRGEMKRLAFLMV